MKSCPSFCLWELKLHQAHSFEETMEREKIDTLWREEIWNAFGQIIHQDASSAYKREAGTQEPIFFICSIEYDTKLLIIAAQEMCTDINAYKNVNLIYKLPSHPEHAPIAVEEDPELSGQCNQQT